MYQCSSSIFISTFNIIIPDILILLDLTYSHLHLDQRFSYKLTKSSLLSTFPPPCHVCVMWFCWLHLLVTSSWGNLWPSVKQLQWKLALQTLRPLFSARKWWTADSGSDTRLNPSWKSLNISGSCSWGDSGTGDQLKDRCSVSDDVDTVGDSGLFRLLPPWPRPILVVENRHTNREMDGWTLSLPLKCLISQH